MTETLDRAGSLGGSVMPEPVTLTPAPQPGFSDQRPHQTQPVNSPSGTKASVEAQNTGDQGPSNTPSVNALSVLEGNTNPGPSNVTVTSATNHVGEPGPVVPTGSTTATDQAQQPSSALDQTISAGGEATIAGTPVSVAGDGSYAVIDGTTIPTGSVTASPAQAPGGIIGGQTITTGSAGQYVVNGQTITAGGAATVAGTPISIASGGSYAVVGGGTISLGAAATTSPSGLGGYIMSGIGGIGPASSVIVMDAATYTQSESTVRHTGDAVAGKSPAEWKIPGIWLLGVLLWPL